MTSNVYEVRCERCRTSFPPETRRCFYCGGPLGPGLGRWLSSSAATGGGAAPEVEGEDEILQVRGRNILWVVTAALALGASLLRSCMEGS